MAGAAAARGVHLPDEGERGGRAHAARGAARRREERAARGGGRVPERAGVTRGDDRQAEGAPGEQGGGAGAGARGGRGRRERRGAQGEANPNMAWAQP
eukprot:2120343-Prymnesium_polylepis.1